MLLRIVDYVGNPGGGVRFAVEMVEAMAGRPGLRIELVSHGEALERYRALLPGGAAAVRDLPQANLWRTSPNFRRSPWRRLGRWTGRGTSFHFDVPAAALRGADVVWLPWLHRHRLPRRGAERVVASLHDVILLDFRAHVPPEIWKDEWETVRGWLASPARVVVSSEATAGSLERVFGTPRSRLSVVRLCGQHRQRPPERAPAAAPFAGQPYLFCPANTFVHKNHETLFDGFAAWGARRPLVLTGGGSELAGKRGRGAELRARAEARGLALGRDLFGLGYVPDPEYFHLLRRAWALVMPTRAEGGGSFPVMEALFEGVPVLCSDIPVMRENLAWMGGEVQWFDPDRPDELAARLRELERDYPAFKRRAGEQVARLSRRGWADVAAAYQRLFGLPDGGAP